MVGAGGVPRSRSFFVILFSWVSKRRCPWRLWFPRDQTPLLLRPWIDLVILPGISHTWTLEEAEVYAALGHGG